MARENVRGLFFLLRMQEYKSCTKKQFPNLKKTKKTAVVKCRYIIFPYLCPIVITT